MKLEEYAALDATALGELVAAGEVTAAELVALARAAYDALNPKLNAILEFYEDAESVRGADRTCECQGAFVRPGAHPTLFDSSCR